MLVRRRKSALGHPISLVVEFESAALHLGFFQSGLGLVWAWKSVIEQRVAVLESLEGQQSN